MSGRGMMALSSSIAQLVDAHRASQSQIVQRGRVQAFNAPVVQVQLSAVADH